jgi:hypothetical protein
VVSVETFVFRELAGAFLLPPEASQVLDTGAAGKIVGRVVGAHGRRNRSRAWRITALEGSRVRGVGRKRQLRRRLTHGDWVGVE